MILPAFGMISEIIPVFARKPIFGYKAIAFSTIGIAFAGMLVWAHHMFTVGLPVWLNGFFAVTSFAVAIPTAIKIFNWLATLWRGHLEFKAPLLFCARPDRALHRSAASPGSCSRCSRSTTRRTTPTTSSRTCTTCSSAERPSGSSRAPTTGSRRSPGRMYDERLAKWHFWLHLHRLQPDVLLPAHASGCMGMPRRVYTYDRGGSFELYNLLSTIGAWVMAVGAPDLRLQHDQELAQRARASGTTPGGRTRSSGTRPRRRPTHNFDRCRRHERSARCATCACGCEGPQR